MCLSNVDHCNKPALFVSDFCLRLFRFTNYFYYIILSQCQVAENRLLSGEIRPEIDPSMNGAVGRPHSSPTFQYGHVFGCSVPGLCTWWPRANTSVYRRCTQHLTPSNTRGVHVTSNTSVYWRSTYHPTHPNTYVYYRCRQHPTYSNTYMYRRCSCETPQHMCTTSIRATLHVTVVYTWCATPTPTFTGGVHVTFALCNFPNTQPHNLTFISYRPKIHWPLTEQ